jgi:hypothetical protein
MGLKVASSLELRKKAKSSFSVTTVKKLHDYGRNDEIETQLELINSKITTSSKSSSSTNKTFAYTPKLGTNLIHTTALLNLMYLRNLQSDSKLSSSENP